MGKIDSKAVGLDIGLSAVKFLTGSENLHYGIWDGLEVTAENVGAAQTAYTDKLFELLPKTGPLAILDIGGGAGETAKKLIDLGHSVEIVVPSAFLAERCREKCGPDTPVHEMMFEDFQTSKKFDICLFSESFQYIPLDASLPKARGLLNEDGRVIIADCFRKPAYYSPDRPSRVGGGWRYTQYREIIEAGDWEEEFFEDVTDKVAPSVQVEQDFFNVIGHAVTRVSAELAEHKPILFRILRGVVKMALSERRRAKLDERLNGQTRSAANFAALNTYIFTRLRPVSNP
ncbi:MAG: class I SAM-dependent methyltransferase [Pseudomonadota bacterium]